MFAALAPVLLVGCTDRALSFGDNADYYFWSDHETGDTSDWTDRGPHGGFVVNAEATIDVELGPSRSGTHSLHVHGVNPSTGGWTTALVARNRPLPTEAYYSAWYFLPEALAPHKFWDVALFRSRAEATGDTPFRNEFAVQLGPTVKGELSVQLLGGNDEVPQPIQQLAVPVAIWFQLEVYQRIASDGSGRLTAWQDGVEIYDFVGPTSATPYVEWMVGTVVDHLDTPAADLYIDDAAITRRRLGSAGGPFTR